MQFIFSNHVRLCAIFFDDDVLILPSAVSTPVGDGPHFFNVGSWLINLHTMASLQIGESPFISLVLFQFGCFTFSVEAFKQFKSKVCILIQQYLV